MRAQPASLARLVGAAAPWSVSGSGKWAGWHRTAGVPVCVGRVRWPFHPRSHLQAPSLTLSLAQGRAPCSRGPDLACPQQPHHQSSSGPAPLPVCRPAHPPERGVCRPPEEWGGHRAPRLPQGSRPGPQRLRCVPCGQHGPRPAELAEPRLGPAWSEPLPRLPRQRVALCSWASVPSCAV